MLTDQSVKWGNKMTRPLILHKLKGKQEDLIKKNLSATINCMQDIINRVIESTNN